LNDQTSECLLKALNISHKKIVIEMKFENRGETAKQAT
jgi:hypothetical protein